MSMKKALLLSVLIPAALALSLPASAMGPGGGPERDRPAFSEVDTNGDGALTLEEIMAHRDARFDGADSDGDGSLSREELIAAAMGRVEDRIDRMMDRFDDDENGVLSANELDDMRPRGPGPERIFGVMDADGDGSVTEAEFDAVAERMMERRGGHGWGRHGGGDGHGQRWWGGSDDG